MTTPGTTTAGTTTPGTSTTKPTTGSVRRHRRSLAVLGASVTAAALFGLASPAFAGQGPVAPAFQGFGPGPTTTVPDPEVNIELPNVGLVTPTTPPETIPPQPPDPQVTRMSSRMLTMWRRRPRLRPSRPRSTRTAMLRRSANRSTPPLPSST